MVSGMIGKKLGMTQVFDDRGNIVPVTVIRVGPCVVVQKKSEASDGYNALQLGFIDAGRKAPRATRPLEGHFKRAGVPPTRILREFPVAEHQENDPGVGENVLVGDVFRVNEKVRVSGISKGRGFQGVVKRHGFRGGKASHGSMFHRAPGSIGQSAYPSRVLPGMKAAGQMGNKSVTVRRLRVVQIDPENHLILVKGAVPGCRGNYVTITRSKGE